MSAEKIKRPSFQFYPADWRKDTQLQTCSIEARGLWHEMICLMHECEPYGHLTVNGQPMEPAKLARLVGMGPKECAAALAELEEAGVFSRTEWGAIYSRRMVKDEAVRNKRAAGGQDGAEHGKKGAEYGKKGKRPSGGNGGLEPPLGDGSKGSEKPPLYPPPSSSSSSSVTTPIPPSQPSAEGGCDGEEKDLLGGKPRRKRAANPEVPLPSPEWEPSDEAKAWTATELSKHGLTDEWAWTQLDAMRDYARQHPLWKHADWDATWRNWVRKAIERLPRAARAA